MFCVANLATAEGDSFADLVRNAVTGAGYAVLAGVALGCPAGRAMRRCLGAGWATPGGVRLAALALPFLTYAAAVLIGGNGFVAAFVAGLCCARTADGPGDEHLGLVRDAGHLMALAVWFTFGALIAEEFAHGVGLPVLAYALLALTVARMLPVAVALTGTAHGGAERAAIGWFGSRGVTSIVFAVLAYTRLDGDDAAFVVNVTCATVLLSVVLHGVTAEPAARWFERRPRNPAVPAGPDGARRTSE